MFDSTEYYLDSLRLLAGQEFLEISTRRPFFTSFFSFLLWVTNHNLLHALTILTLFVAIACYLLASEINRTHGPVIAAFVLTFIFFYYRFHSGAVRSENLGVLFGVLGTALIWRGISKNFFLYIIAGFLLTSFGTIARAGAFFVLPLQILWAGISYRGYGKIISWRYFIGGSIAIIIPFIANQLIMQSFGKSDVVPFGNFSYSLYGLASGGKSWAYVLEIYPRAGYSEIYNMAIQLILEQPGLFVQGVFYNFSTFFSNTIYGLFSYMSGEGGLSSTISYWVLMLLSVLGVWNWLRNRDDPYLRFVIFSSMGLMISVPFLPPTDAFRLRAYAASIVILALISSMGLHYLLVELKAEKVNQRGIEFIGRHSLAWFCFIAVLVLLIGPFVARGTDLRPELNPPACDRELASLTVRYDPGTMIHIVPQNSPVLDWAPTYRMSTLRRSVHGFPDFRLMDWVLKNVRPNHTLFYALDYRSFQNALILVKSDALPAPPALLDLCGNWEENPDVSQFRIFNTSNVIVINSD